MSELHEAKVRILEMEIKQMELDCERAKLDIAAAQRVIDEVGAYYAAKEAPEPALSHKSIGDLVSEFKRRFMGGG